MLLFVIVCLNAGGLLLFRSNERSFDTSVRLALGASWQRLARRTVAETGVICLLGGTAGLLFALAAIRLLNRGGQLGELHFAAPVFLFGAAMTAVTTAVCALYPVLAVARTNPADALNAGGYQSTGSRGKQHWRRALVISQVAASTVLLAVGGLLLESYIRLLQEPLGFEAERVATMQISLPALRYQSESSRRIFYDRVLEKIRHTPGVTSASACTLLPFGYGESVQPFRIAGQPATSAPQFANVNRILPEFFHTLRIPLVAGRFLDARDRPGSEPAVLIDQRLARQYFPDGNPVGQQIELSPGSWFSIVGVVGNIRIAGLDVASRPMLYFSAVQMPVTDMSLLVKTSAAMDRLPAIVQDVVAKIDANQPVYDIASLESRIEHSLSTRHFVVWIVISFAAIGTAITAIGLYGLLSYSVSLRLREFGIRAAMGANPRDLAALVFRHGILLAVAGAPTGGLAAVFAARYLSSELYGVPTIDSLTWLSIGFVLAAISVLACIEPCWRASRTNPLALLKQN
jgi:predicted permease